MRQYFPNTMLIVALALIAQPLASKRGARFLFRNFNQANIIEGPEIDKTTPIIAKGICHHFNPKKLEKIETNTVPMAPMAKLKAAKIPTNLPISNGGGGVFGCGICFAALEFTRQYNSIVGFSFTASILFCAAVSIVSSLLLQISRFVW